MPLRTFSKVMTLAAAASFALTWASEAVAAIPAAGGDLVRIVVADPKDPVQKACAADLQRIFTAVTGQSIDVATEPLPGRCVYIGGAPATYDLSGKLKGLEEQGIVLSISPEQIICTGTTPQGVYNAVQELLYQTGYRNIWPGRYGECLPKGPTLELGKAVEMVRNPSFELRGGHTVQMESRPGEKPKHIDPAVWTDWAARNRVNRYKGGYCHTWDYGPTRAHGWQEIAGHSIQDILLPAYEFGKKYPEEWYALFEGKRHAKHPIGTTVQPCLSNAAFVDHSTAIVLDYFHKNPNGKRYLIGHSDEPTYWCECDGCKAMDPVQFAWIHEGGTKQERYNMSDRWFTYVNTVADRVAKEFPDKWIATYSYASTRELPVRTVIAKNVMVEMTIPLVCRKHHLFDETCPDNITEATRLREWGKVSPAMSSYSYLEFAHWGIPISFFDSATDLYRSLHKVGVRHISDEIDSSADASPVYIGLWSRLMWDVDTDPNEYITDFCRIAYGAAASDMERFWRNQQEVMQNSKVAHRGYTDIERFTPAVVKASNDMIDQALTRSLTKDEIARVNRARMALLMAEYYESKTRAAATDSSAWVTSEKAREAVYQLSRDFGFPIDLFAWNALGGGEQMFMPIPVEIQDDTYKLPAEALGGELLVALPDPWHLRTDPTDVGVKENWFADGGSLDGFKPINTNAIWEDQWVGSYDGYAWYVTDVTIPETPPGKRVWILFGAVDETWKLWLCGNYIGSSKGKPMEVWDRPAAIEITNKYPPGLKVRLAVQVHDIGRAGGIWKPATIVTSEKPTAPAGK